MSIRVDVLAMDSGIVEEVQRAVSVIVPNLNKKKLTFEGSMTERL